jgi:YedE family putative selenium metabolism protein
MRRFFGPKAWIIAAGLALGALAALLVKLGNPPNMGVCGACFIRDIAGALGLDRASTVQYLRPEVIGFVLGAMVSSYSFRDFRARGGSTPLVRFLLGMLMMVGALVFLGCPIRATLRLAGGDLNGLTGLAGMAGGVAVGVVLLRRGFSLGRAVKQKVIAGWIMPVFMAVLLLLAFLAPPFIFSSQSGPGSMRAPVLISLGAGLLVGFLAQRSRMCFAGAFRDLILVKDGYLVAGVVSVLLSALVFNLILGQFKLGFEGQPIAHSSHLWNFLGMALLGLAAVLAGGCPLRQSVLSGEGDTDAAVTVTGLIAGAASAHNFGLASSAEGPSALGPWAVIAGLAICLALGLTMKEKTS